MGTRLRTLALVLAALPALTWPAAGTAQQGWTVDLLGGRSSFSAIGAPADADGLVVGVRHAGAWWLSASAGVPLDPGGLPWGALGVGGRLSTAGDRLALALDGAAHGYGYQDPIAEVRGGGFTVEAMPVLRLDAGAVVLEARSGILHHTRLLPGEVLGRTLHQSDARVTLGGRGTWIAAETRYLRGPEGGYPYVGAAAAGEAGRLRVAAYAGRWATELITTPVWGFSSVLRLGGGADAQVGFHQETSDPLYWNTPRRSWSAGLSYRLGSPPQQRPVHAPPRVEQAGTTFRLPLSASASAPSVAGDFSGWAEVRMARSGDVWTVTIPVARGTHRFAFRRSDGEWFVPDGYPGREPDGFGGFNALLLVP